ncbi:uncharacterized protein PV09_05064 [Verruconis gallopava]|uniref:Chromosome condensation protein n=1 Tax=Verruconis gallopava TaxID=253628 RepID=A0A0D2AX45_9PEZI|nr:uncharacterized protein PV09_05064 [Verruconis gallopava]KIW03759.1 hypothetical protein PV09_05064 [Verruconis gallopava]
MVHWVFSTFGKQPVASPRNSRVLVPTPSAAVVEPSGNIIQVDNQQETIIASPKSRSPQDIDFNSQRASAGSSTLNAGRSRAQTTESTQSVSHNIGSFGEPAAFGPAGFYSRNALEQPQRRTSLESGADNEPRPNWPLPESILTCNATPPLTSAANPPGGLRGVGHRRCLSNSSRRETSSSIMLPNQELLRSNSERIGHSHENLRSNSRAHTTPSYFLENLTEVAGPPQGGGLDENLIRRQSSGQTLLASLPEQPIHTPYPPEILVQERTSSRRAPTITLQSSNLRDVDPGMLRPKSKGKLRSEAKSRRLQEIQSSQQTSLKPQDQCNRPTGSRSGDTDATALPRFLYNQSNLEEQLEAARIFQSSSPQLSVVSVKNGVASRLATELYTFSYLIFFSILGTLARIGLQALTFYPGAPVVISALWPNFAGSFLLGFFAEDRRLFREEWSSHKPQIPSFDPKRRDITSSPTSEKFCFPKRKGHRDEDHPSQVLSHGKVKKTIPLYIGLTTGFCGSFTSFSTFMRDTFLALSNNLPTPINHTYPQGFTLPAATDTVQRHSGYSFMSTLAVLLLTVCLSVGGLQFGAHLAIFLDQYIPTIRFHILRRFIDPLFVFLAWGAWIGAVIMTIWPPDRSAGPGGKDIQDVETWRGEALFACVFAPPGCLMRFYVSVFLNGLSVSFPLGTFAVNVFGTAVEAMAFDLQHIRIASLVGGGRLPCQVLQGIMEGFCGSLTTVSAWAAQLSGLKRHHAYVYGLSSLVGGLSLTVVIMGSVRWTVGWGNPVCLA